MPPKEKKAKSKSKKKQPITEEKMRKIEKAKEDRSIALFYKISEPEPEEEPFERKISRKKKELKNNTFYSY